MKAIAKYLEDKILELDQKPALQVTNDDTLPRDVLFYIWLLSYQRGSGDKSKTKCVNVDELVAWIGKPLANDIDAIIINGDLSDYLRKVTSEGKVEYCISVDDIAAVQGILEKHYAITSIVPYLGIKGYEYVRWINSTPQNATIFRKVTEAFNHILNRAVSSRQVEIVSVNNNSLLLVRGPNAIWYFLIAIAPNKLALTQRDIQDILHELIIARGRLERNLNITDQNLNILLLAPDTENTDLFDVIAHYPRIYHVWPLEMIRFCLLLEDIIKTGRGASDLVERFISIFPPHIQDGFSAKEAVDRLKKTN
ncbi:MAG: hypothetical protein OHK0046_11090 [Anaerolineae bacterium]